MTSKMTTPPGPPRRSSTRLRAKAKSQKPTLDQKTTQAPGYQKITTRFIKLN